MDLAVGSFRTKSDKEKPVSSAEFTSRVVVPEAAGTGARINWAPLLLLAPLVLLLLVFFVGPVAFNLQESLRAPGVETLTTTTYARILTDGYYLKVLGQTILLGFGVTALCLIVGYPFAYVIARAQGAWKAVLIFVLVAPLLVNVVVRSFGWMVILGGSGVINTTLRAVGLPAVELMYTWTGITIAMVHVLLPFMVLAIASTLETLDLSLEEAASVLGASNLRTFFHVTFPLSKEGVVTGAILTFTLTIGSFVTVMLLGKNATMVLPLLIYQRLTVASDWPTAAALGIILLAVVLAILWLQVRLLRTKPRAYA
jgi:putative spermidine/putrescine transport system permease protein